MVEIQNGKWKMENGKWCNVLIEENIILVLGDRNVKVILTLIPELA